MGNEYSKVNYLKGPITLSYYKNHKTGKEIYIFGDNHVYQPKCKGNVTADMDIVTFIKKTLEANPDKTIDLFVESAMKTAQSQELAIGKYGLYIRSYSSGYINVIQSTFWDCETYKKKCPYNMRYHYIDWRMTGDPNFKEYTMYIDAIKSGEFFITYDSIPNTTSKESTDYATFKQKNKFDDKNFTLNGLLKNLKIQKQLDNIKDKNIRNKIYNWIKDFYTMFVKPSKYFNTLDRQRKEIITLQSKYNIQLQNKNLADIGNDNTTPLKLRQKIGEMLGFHRIAFYGYKIVQDAYALARMFRSFDEGPPIQYIMLYVGAAHIDFYDSILPDLGFQLVNTSSDDLWENRFKYLNRDVKDLESHQCIYIGDFDQPFFKT